jgi:superfamily II DNA or RNA helicase
VSGIFQAPESGRSPGSDRNAPSAQSSGGSGRAPSLRHYQTGALVAIDRELEVHRSTLVNAATGTGKTVTFAERARINAARGVRTLILVNRDELVRQTRRKCEAVGLYPDVEKAKNRASTMAKVVIASVQSLRGARLTRWARDHFAEVIVDECHHAAAKIYQAILDWFTDAKVVGFTATPARADGKSLGDTFDSVAFTYDIRQAIAEQFLVPIVARRIIVDSIDLRGIDSRAGDFAQDQLAKVMDDERALRGVAVPLMEQARDRLTIAFCVNVKHAQDLARVLNSMRPGCARAVSGETDDLEREQLLAAHTAGEFQYLVNCDLLVEGYDSPAVACVAMCRPTQSWARFVQCAGRGLRLLGDTYAESIARGKRDCLLLDFTGATKHALIGPADCLAQPDELDDDVRAEIERQLAMAQLEIGAVITNAKSEIEKRREQMRLAAVIRYHAEYVDPFIGSDEIPLPACDPAFEQQPPSDRQRERLEELGVTTSKLPREFTRADAWRLIAQLQRNDRQGPGTYSQLRKLHQAGVKEPYRLTPQRVRELMNKLASGNGNSAHAWRPAALAREPECRDAFPLRREGAA